MSSRAAAASLSAGKSVVDGAAKAIGRVRGTANEPGHGRLRPSQGADARHSQRLMPGVSD